MTQVQAKSHKCEDMTRLVRTGKMESIFNLAVFLLYFECTHVVSCDLLLFIVYSCLVRKFCPKFWCDQVWQKANKNSAGKQDRPAHIHLIPVFEELRQKTAKTVTLLYYSTQRLLPGRCFSCQKLRLSSQSAAADVMGAPLMLELHHI